MHLATFLTLATTALAAPLGIDAKVDATQSPGVGSGNPVQAPVHVPVNVAGNTGSLIIGLDPTFDDEGVEFKNASYRGGS
ncbi:hypothetical protein NLG97_g219 [Lecanicillium saksenae]|uniref:Uncharacterized protein n=1 Tax=Lecanicillium saksenae TaxID=468837 RepID=A0ACC1R8Y7_9HYPO|nr:hypothetical protein NLG97_g219 [Lecanicillium saksenae]